MNYDEILKQLKIEGNPTPCARFTFSIPNAKEELVTAMSAVLGAMGERFVWLPEYDKVAEWLSANNGKGLLQNLEIPEFCRILPEETAKLPEESPNTPEFCREVKKSIISSPYVEDINNPPLYPPEGEEDYIPTEFVTLWDKFKGKRKSLTDDYKDFCKKTEGLVIDYVKLQRSAQFAKNVYFQTWLNDFFPKKSRRNIDLSAVEPAFQPIMADWLAYKSERGQTYRPLGLQRCYVRLLTLSGNDAAKARRIVDFSIANNYSGLFPPHDQDNSANRHPATDYHAQPGQTYEDF